MRRALVYLCGAVIALLPAFLQIPGIVAKHLVIVWVITGTALVLGSYLEVSAERKASRSSVTATALAAWRRRFARSAAVGDVPQMGDQPTWPGVPRCEKLEAALAGATGFLEVVGRPSRARALVVAEAMAAAQPHRAHTLWVDCASSSQPALWLRRYERELSRLGLSAESIGELGERLQSSPQTVYLVFDNIDRMWAQADADQGLEEWTSIIAPLARRKKALIVGISAQQYTKPLAEMGLSDVSVRLEQGSLAEIRTAVEEEGIDFTSVESLIDFAERVNFDVKAARLAAREAPGRQATAATGGQAAQPIARESVARLRAEVPRILSQLSFDCYLACFALLTWGRPASLEEFLADLDWMVEPKRSTGLQTLKQLEDHLIVLSLDGRLDVNRGFVDAVRAWFLERVAEEIRSCQYRVLDAFPILDPRWPEPRREHMRNSFISPLLHKLVRESAVDSINDFDDFGGAHGVVYEALAAVEEGHVFALGNLLNLAAVSGSVISDLALPGRRLYAADLRNYQIRDTDFSGARVKGCVFAERQAAITAVALSKHGKDMVAAGDSLGAIRIWDLTSRELRWTVPAHGGGVRAVLFGPDDETVISAGEDGEILIWDPRSGSRSRLLGHVGYVWSLALVGDRLLSVGADGLLHVWSVAAQQEVRAVRVDDDPLWCVIANADRAFLCGESGGLWEVNWNQPPGSEPTTRQLYACAEPLKAITLPQSGDGVAVLGTDSGRIVVVETVSGTAIRESSLHRGVVRCLASSDSGWFLSCSDDGSLMLHERERVLATKTGLSGHSYRVWAVDTFGDLAVSGGDDRAVKVWRIRDGLIELEWEFVGHADTVLGLCGEGQGIVTAIHENGFLRRWNRSQDILLREQHTPARPNAVASLPSTTVVGTEDGRIYIVPHEARGMRDTWVAHRRAISSLATMPRYGVIITASEDRSVKSWTLRGELLHEYHLHANRVWSIAVARDEALFATGGGDRVLALWLLGEEYPVWQRREHLGPIRAVGFSPDGNMVTSGGSDSLVLVHSANGDLLFSVDVPLMVRGLVWSAATGKIYVAGLPSRRGGAVPALHVIDLDSQTARAVWQPDAPVTSLSEIEDGNLAVGLANGSVHIIAVRDLTAAATVLDVPLPYRGLVLTGARGVSEPAAESLRRLGAVI